MLILFFWGVNEGNKKTLRCGSSRVMSIEKKKREEKEKGKVF